jgi:hypothetical protein
MGNIYQRCKSGGLKIRASQKASFERFYLFLISNFCAIVKNSSVAVAEYVYLILSRTGGKNMNKGPSPEKYLSPEALSIYTDLFL